MKKRLMYVTCFLFLMIPIFNVKALSAWEITSRTECPNIELAEAKEDGSLAKIECYQNYQDAKNVMNNTDNDNLVLIEQGIIIDAKYAVVDYDIDYPSGHQGYMWVYDSATTNNTSNHYIRGGTPDEAAMIEVDYNTKRVKIKVAGLTGWINKYDGSLKLYDIVPLSWVKTPQSYTVTDNTLVHNFPGNVFGTKGVSSLVIDRKPSMLNKGTYYSYDGHYFYTSMKTLLQDYKNNNYNQSINKDNPYYNYYQYLSFRTKTTYNADNINQYLEARKWSSDSKILSTGNYFIKYQESFGINAGLMMAIGINESGFGTSNIAKQKNNLFGLNAIDRDPNQSANYFNTVEDCIRDYSYAWLSYGYVYPGDPRYKGANLGNKAQGLNYRYASDPFWGEKAAHYYYDLDSMYGFQDYNTYQLAALNDNYENTVYAKKTPGGVNVSSKYYQYKVKDSVVVVLEETTGPSVNGNNIWYKIQSDPTLDSNLEYIGDASSNPKITYDPKISYAYVPAAYFTKINTPVESVPNVPNANPQTPSSPSIEENGAKPEKDTPKVKQVSEIVTEANYKYGAGTIYGIKPNTSIATLKSNLTNTGGVITITDSNGNTKETGNIGTGDKVHITSGTTEVLTVLIYGDINGDGEINKSDCTEILRQYYGYIKYEDIKKDVSDINKDGAIDKVDASQILRQYYGYANISQ